jgi:hypothetical protein
VEINQMLTPGGFELYNRFPYDVEFQWDSRPYVIPAHGIMRVDGVGIARAVISRFGRKIGPQGLESSGVVLRSDPNFGVPLTEEDLNPPDLILGNEVQFADPQNLEVKRFAADRLPGRRGAVESTVVVLPGKGA